jgi:hypothetical protein
MLHALASRLNRSVRKVSLFLAVLLILCVTSVATWAADGGKASAVPDWSQLVQTHSDRLEKLDSNQQAIDLFVGTIGPAVSLTDAASTLAAKGIPSRMAKELFLPDVMRSAQRLIAALTAWQLSERLTRTLAENTKPAVGAVTVAPPQVDWLTANGPFPSLTETIHHLTTLESAPTGSSDYNGNVGAIAASASRLGQEAGQQAMTEWWRLKTWKDRVRVARGQSRLCGTWQWAIHNHQNHHQEQKLSLIFPPPGKDDTGIVGLSEIVVLGDAVYLRWEMEGKTQEDSLLFSKEGNRLEGTFVNSQGGWGSISGKRTASCTVQ